ncbi:MAG TPA: radical SAM protein [Candidatus Omnitrophota bacterium]|nr:radical SAM protein [Candidatus Omnitrophota bacterium]HPD85431.1 radical SAM protein [Candidatus Omnitrophota bacterium]HRZ04068.1 radical SAM protein [Candidatus Omnitrophota bacterium]
MKRLKGKNMKILILNPSYGDNFVRVARWAAKSRGRVQRHPDYLLVAAQVLINAGHDVSFVEAAARNFTPEQSLALAKDFKPQLLVIHATTPSIYEDIAQAKAIKEQTNCKVAFLGQHVTAEAENTFEISRGTVDYILRREYDYTLRDLASGIKPPEILGLSWRDGSKTINNPPRPDIDVNELPFPAWQLIKPEWYPDAGKKFPFLTLLSGRGCNNGCSFCRDPQLLYGHRARSRDAKLVVDEIEYDLKLYPQIREIMFETDTFTADKNHAVAVCEEIIRRGIHKKICWSCNMRINADLELLPLMKKANCRMLMTGFEFGTDEALRAVRKGGVSVEMARRYAKYAHELGFTIHGCFMIGAPGETKESARATIDLAKSLPLDTIQITGIATYPGTILYQWAKENGYLIPKDWREWLTPQKEQRTLLSYPQLTSEEIDALIDIGLKEFYLRPAQMWRMLISIRSIGDLLRKLYGLGAFIDYFLKKIGARIKKSSNPTADIDTLTQDKPASL